MPTPLSSHTSKQRSHVIIRTRRNTGDRGEPHGWRFETDGIGSFGELRRDETISGGTEVTLRLRREIYGWGKMEPEMLALMICEYLKENRRQGAMSLRIPLHVFARSASHAWARMDPL